MRKSSFVMLALLGCGWPERPDFTLGNGLAVSIAGTSADWAHADGFPAALEAITSSALAYWGGHDLGGWELVLQDRPIDGCGDPSPAGCTTTPGDYIQIHVRAACGEGFDVAASAIAHEIGHAVIGDPDHRDSRWSALSGTFPELHAACPATMHLGT